MFAVRYYLDELEAYCHSNEKVFKEIRTVLEDSKKGLAYLIEDEKVPVSAMNKVIAKMARSLRKAEAR
jgi:nitrate/TMAO reductase-like tetraheme cytochrome c subunit